MTTLKNVGHDLDENKFPLKMFTTIWFDFEAIYRPKMKVGIEQRMTEDSLKKDGFQVIPQEKLRTANYAIGLVSTSLFNKGGTRNDDCISFLSTCRA